MAELKSPGAGNGRWELVEDVSSSEIQHRALSDQVYAVLWQQILDRKLLPGAKISDLQVAEELAVSRTPVREALYRLVQDGIVLPRSQHGFFVASFSSNDIREIFDIRATLEVLSVGLALPNLKDEQIDAARSALAEARRRVEQSGAGAREFWLRVDRDLHRMLASATGNQRLEQLLAGLQAQSSVFQVYGTYFLQVERLALAHHQLILDALARRDSVAAKRSMQQHIEEVKELMLAEFREHEQHSTGNLGT